MWYELDRIKKNKIYYDEIKFNWNTKKNSTQNTIGWIIVKPDP